MPNVAEEYRYRGFSSHPAVTRFTQLAATGYDKQLQLEASLRVGCDATMHFMISRWTRRREGDVRVYERPE